MRNQWALKHNTSATTAYYPSANGVPVTDADRPLRKLVQLSGSGGVTFTVEWTACDSSRGDAAADVWVDVTGECKNLIGTTSTSYVDTTAVLDVSHLPGRYRIAVVTSDAIHDYRITYADGPGTSSASVLASFAPGADMATETTLSSVDGSLGTIASAYYPSLGATGPSGACMTGGTDGYSGMRAIGSTGIPTSSGTHYGLDSATCPMPAGAWTTLRTFAAQITDVTDLTALPTVTGTVDLSGLAYPAALTGKALTINGQTKTFAAGQPTDLADCLAELNAAITDCTFTAPGPGFALVIVKDTPGNLAISGTAASTLGLTVATTGNWVALPCTAPAVDICFPPTFSATGTATEIVLRVWRLNAAFGGTAEIVLEIRFSPSNVSRQTSRRIPFDGSHAAIQVAFTGDASATITGTAKIRAAYSTEVLDHAALGTATMAGAMPVTTATDDTVLTGGTQKTQINNGANVAAVKAASTAAAATDPALVVALSPNGAPGAVVKNTPAGVAFAVADLAAGGVTGSNWKKIGEVSSADYTINACSLAVQIDVAAAVAGQYGDSVEVILVPWYAPTGGAEPTVTLTTAPALACAVAWLWGTGPAATPFVAFDPWTVATLQEVLYATGRSVQRWIAYARTGMAAGETCTVTITAQLVGTLGNSIGAPTAVQNSGAPLERISDLCTVPPFEPGRKGLDGGTLFPYPLQQVSMSPRQWRGKSYTQTIAASTFVYVAKLGGGPWHMSYPWSSTCLLAASMTNYMIDAVGETNCYTGAVYPVTSGFRYHHTSGGGAIYPPMIATNILQPNLAVGAEVLDRTYTMRPYLYWGLL